VVVEPKLMDYKTENYRFDNKGNVSGSDMVQVFSVEVRNTRDVPAKIEIVRNFKTPTWDIKRSGDEVAYEKVDLDTVKFSVEMAPQSKKTFEYTLTTYQGVRAEDAAKRSSQPR